jgi:hypothetical protein
MHSYENEITKLKKSLAEKDAVLNNIYSSNAWKLVSRYYCIRDKVRSFISKWSNFGSIPSKSNGCNSLKQIQKAHAIYVPKYKFIYFFIPKAACTSLKRWIQVMMDWPTDNDPHYDENVSGLLLYKIDDESINQLLKDPSIFKFAISRNPWSRLISSYSNKIIYFQRSLQEHLKESSGPREKSINEFMDTFYETFTTDIMRELCPDEEALLEGISFRQFVEYIVAQNPPEQNPHWMPQWIFLEGIKLDFLGTVENLKEDFREIQNRIGYHEPLPKENITRITKKSGQITSKPLKNYSDMKSSKIASKHNIDYKELTEGFRNKYFYDKALLNLVASYYEKDIKLFGYVYDENK